MSAGSLRALVSDHPRLVGAAFAATVLLSTVSPVAAGCWDAFIGP